MDWEQIWCWKPLVTDLEAMDKKLAKICGSSFKPRANRIQSPGRIMAAGLYSCGLFQVSFRVSTTVARFHNTCRRSFSYLLFSFLFDLFFFCWNLHVIIIYEYSIETADWFFVVVDNSPRCGGKRSDDCPLLQYFFFSPLNVPWVALCDGVADVCLDKCYIFTTPLFNPTRNLKNQRFKKNRNYFYIIPTMAFEGGREKIRPRHERNGWNDSVVMSR